MPKIKANPKSSTSKKPNVAKKAVATSEHHSPSVAHAQRSTTRTSPPKEEDYRPSPSIGNDVVAKGRVTRSKAQKPAAEASSTLSFPYPSSMSTSASSKRQASRKEHRMVPYVDLVVKQPAHLKPRPVSPSLAVALASNPEMRDNHLWQKKVTEEHAKACSQPFDVPNWHAEKFAPGIQGLRKYYLEKIGEKNEAAASARAKALAAAAAALAAEEEAAAAEAQAKEEAATAAQAEEEAAADGGDEEDGNVEMEDDDETTLNVFSTKGKNTAFVQALKSGHLMHTPSREPPLESDVTPSDYIEGLSAAKRRRAQKQRREVSNTEDEDLEDDLELTLEAEVSPERGSDKSASACRCAAPAPVDSLEDSLKEEDRRIARHVRRLNAYNLHGIVYARLHPKMAWESKPDFSQRRSADYEMRKGSTNQDMKRLTAELLMDHHEIVSDPSNLRAAARRVRFAEKQLLTVSENLARNSPDIVTMSACIYIGPDQAGRQASCVVSGSPEGIDFLTGNELPVQLLIDTIGDHIRSKSNPAALAAALQRILGQPEVQPAPTSLSTSEVQAPAGSASTFKIHTQAEARHQEPMGRRQLKKVTEMVPGGRKVSDKEYFVDAMAQKIRVATGLSLVNINWKFFLDVYCLDHQLTLVGWPDSVGIHPIYGLAKITLDFKRLDWKALTNAIKFGSLEFVEWSDEQKAFDTCGDEYMDIPLFITQGGLIRETVGSVIKDKEKYKTFQPSVSFASVPTHISASGPPPPAAPAGAPTVSCSPAPDSEDEGALQMPLASAPTDNAEEGDFLGYAVMDRPVIPGVKYDPIDVDYEVAVVRKVPAAARRGEMGPMAYKPKPSFPGPQNFYSGVSYSSSVPPSHRIYPKKQLTKNSKAQVHGVRKAQVGQPYVGAAEAQNYRYQSSPNQPEAGSSKAF